jgi:hypothetical protein
MSWLNHTVATLATIDDDKESDDSLESGNDSDNNVLNIFMNLLTIINNDHITD